jgi:hypothetical protein
VGKSKQTRPQNKETENQTEFLETKTKHWSHNLNRRVGR